MRVILGLLVLVPVLVASNPDFGFLRARFGSFEDSERFRVSIMGFSEASFPSQPREGTYLPVHTLFDQDGEISLGCEPYAPIDGAVVVRRGNCTFQTKAINAEAAGAKALVVVSNESSLLTIRGGDYRTPLMAVFISHADGLLVSEADEISIFVPGRKVVSLVVLWFMAVGTVFLGAWWAAPPFGERSDEQSVYAQANNSEELPTMSISPIAAVGFIVFASAALLFLFFFMKVLVWVIIIAFALGSISATYTCTYSVITWLSCVRGSGLMRVIQIPWLGPSDVLSLLIIPCSFALAVLFVVYRHSSFAWIMQDFIGICLCLMFFKTFRFPNMKPAAVLLILAFVYDIFFVFVTPLITRNRKSVMVEVATGGGSGESLPMLLVVPEPCDGCSPGMLGLGDIVLPGLFVCYTLAFDRANRLRGFSGYFVFNIIGYGIGLLITYLSLLLMNKGQPALLYLVPMTLGLTSVIAFFRGHIRALWENTSAESLPLVSRVGDLTDQ